MNRNQTLKTHAAGIILLLLTLMLLLGSCEPTGVKSVRDNTFDPKNDAYVPAAPTNIRVVAEDRIVRVNWTRNTEHADGYLIQKSINSSDDFKEIGTVGPEDFRFTDQSNTFGVPTLYKVTSFVLREGVMRSNPTNPASLSMGLFLVLPYQISADGTTIELHWRHFLRLRDGYLIHVKVDQVPEWELHVDYRPGITDDNLYSYTYALNGSESFIQFRVSPYFDKDDGKAVINGHLFPVVELQ